jgi:predicted transglutaminase-like cysteine proteinase
MGILEKIFGTAAKQGKEIHLAGETFIFQLSQSLLERDMFRQYDDLIKQKQSMLANFALLAQQDAMFSAESCGKASPVISTLACEVGRRNAGDDIQKGNQAYQKILDDAASQIAASDGYLHYDPRINKIMIVDCLVNNLIKYTRDDPNVDGTKDLWQDPRATALRLKGDCEDYAFLKLKLLQDLKLVDKDEAYAMMVKRKDGTGHATLVAKGEYGSTYVFENISLDDDIPNNQIKPQTIPLDKYLDDEVAQVFTLFNGHDIYKNAGVQNKVAEQAPLMNTPKVAAAQP